MDNHDELLLTINQLCRQQHFAVLCTQHSGQPYASLVAFAVTDDLRYLCFATKRDTRKHHNLVANPRVALLIDSRRGYPGDLSEASALTICGCVITPDDATRTEACAIYRVRHPELAAFLTEPDTALILVAVDQFVLVDNFQKVRTLIVPSQETPFPWEC